MGSLIPSVLRSMLRIEGCDARSGPPERERGQQSVKPIPRGERWIVDAHRGDGKRFVVHADEKLTAFLELERAIHQFAVDLMS